MEHFRSTFRRCADRNPRTRRRSVPYPRGIDPTHPDVVRDNHVTAWTADTLRWTSSRGYAAILVHPADSYFWPVLDSEVPAPPSNGIDVDFTCCSFGSTHRGATRLRVYGGVPLSGLAKTCRRHPGGWTCGNPGHAPCGVADSPGANAYPPLLIQRWAALLARWALAPTSRSRVGLISSGRVLRHRDRGESPESRRQRHLREDAASTAGARNPADVVIRMPSTLAVMSKVRVALLSAMDTYPALRNLHRACGSPPARTPPSDRAVKQARAMVCRAIGLEPADGERHHVSSTLRYGLFEALVEATGDRDKAPPRWLRDGAPLGILAPIPTGGHFPPAKGDPPSSIDVLEHAPLLTRNHPSFSAESASGERPAQAQLQELLDKGFARLYVDRAAAEHALGGKCHPAPLGDVVKALPGGGSKHRLIQDLRRNLVNLCVALSERQVLPRFSDHASDLALASALGEIETLILDFQNAFMSVPASSDEARYNCCLVEAPITRTRPALDATEPESGRFLVWTVLGFGGKAYPLLYARVP